MKSLTERVELVSVELESSNITVMSNMLSNSFTRCGIIGTEHQ